MAFEKPAIKRIVTEPVRPPQPVTTPAEPVTTPASEPVHPDS